MKKIAVLTFHKACNYGAVMQAFALQTFLHNDLGVDAYILDYNSHISNKYKVTSMLHNKGNKIKNFIMFLLTAKDINKRNKLFKQFRDTHYHIEKENLEYEELKTFHTRYDCIISGSDQVWNRDIIGDETAFFLDFVMPPTKKYSYAASLGKSVLHNDDLKVLKTHLDKFDEISVREAEVLPYLKKEFGEKKVTCCLDPVFLLNRKFWTKFANAKRQNPYILVFMMGLSPNTLPALEFARKKSKEKNLEIVYLSDHERWYKFRDLNHYGVANPAEFIGLINNADCVITNSFHATAFSIILHKEFYVETAILRNGRILNLLENTGLENHALIKGVSCKNGLMNTNWEGVDSKLKPLIESSKSYLKGIVEV